MFFIQDLLKKNSIFHIFLMKFVFIFIIFEKFAFAIAIFDKTQHLFLQFDKIYIFFYNSYTKFKFCDLFTNFAGFLYFFDKIRIFFFFMKFLLEKYAFGGYFYFLIIGLVVECFFISLLKRFWRNY